LTARPKSTRMTSTELARRLSDAVLAFRTSRDQNSLEQLELLARDAAAHVRRFGHGTVDHIVLSAVLRLIVDEVPSVDAVLRTEGWRWFR
ncbi:MAG TPA: hypothetical protein VHO25_24910, partial [Polyangiaceae bacterium]|nr:hypothetical protein [Polyangiaceae bacterium]